MGANTPSAGEKPHAVCVPFPAQGHVTPMMKLAKILHGKGFHVTFVNTEYNHRRLARSRGPAAVAGLPDFRFATIPDGLPPSDADATQDPESLCYFTMTTCLPHMKKLLVDLNDTAGVPPVTCVVGDNVMSFCLDAAAAVGVPCALFWTASASGYMGYRNFRFLMDEGLSPLKGPSCCSHCRIGSSRRPHVCSRRWPSREPVLFFQVPHGRPHPWSSCEPSPFFPVLPGGGCVVVAYAIGDNLYGRAESYTLTGSASEVDMKPREVSISVVSSIMDIPPAEWDACAVDSAEPEKLNPFLTHAFLSSLEESGSAVKETGWLPLHVVARDENGDIVGVVPLYLKSHSRGEFVFDQSWAEAYHSYGLEYYPKLQSCVPFTPVTGQRILLRDTSYRDQVFDALVKALKNLATKLNVSSLHITFPSEGEFGNLKDRGLLQRIGLQYHWRNRNYKSFDDFLMDLKQPKRKNIRQERKKIPAQNLKMKRLRGDEIKSSHWDTFYKFYRNTTDNHWGRAYLTREFFHLLGEKMGDKVMLIVAEHDDKLVAGALNLIGGDTLYGRLWGCLPDVHFPNLHFEACYYQAIEAAIELNLSRVEAGAQGEHKIQRGYLPVTTYSCHYFLEPGFATAIGNFLVHETAQVKHVINVLRDSGPYKEDIMKEFAPQLDNEM